MEQRLENFSSKKNNIKKTKSRSFSLAKAIIAVLLTAILFFIFYETMRYFRCTRPLRKAAEAEYKPYVYGNEDNADTFSKETHNGEKTETFEIELSKSIKEPHTVSLYSSEIIEHNGEEYQLQISYSPYHKLWSDTYSVIVYRGINAADMYITSFDISSNGILIPSKTNKDEETTLYSMFKEDFLPMLEKLKNEYKHIIDTY